MHHLRMQESTRKINVARLLTSAGYVNRTLANYQAIDLSHRKEFEAAIRKCNKLAKKWLYLAVHSVIFNDAHLIECPLCSRVHLAEVP